MPASIRAVASHPEGNPPYLSICWAATFTIPANATSTTQTFTVTASSPQISGTKTTTFTVAPT